MHHLQRALSLIYPDQCIVCDTLVETSGGLCSTCWRRTPFIEGLVCDTCGVSLPGHDEGAIVHCDDCLGANRPWDKGRAVLAYRETGRRIVLALKHGDRTDLAPALAGWLARAGKELINPETVLVPVPAHWSRLVARRYNQAAELSRALAARSSLEHCPNALVRTRRTRRQDGMTVDQRFVNVTGAIALNPRRRTRIDGRNVCLIDDVMTSGATLAAGTQALLEAGAAEVCILVLARVEKAP